MWRSLRIQLGVIFFGFLLLISSSVVATFWLVQAQRNDATLINLAGRQRMLAQQMVWLALIQPNSPELESAINRFDQTLHALRDGGIALDAGDRSVTLPPATDRAVRAQLDEVAKSWGTFRNHLQPVDSPALQAETPRILADLDRLANVFESEAQASVTRLQRIQIAFLAATLLLLAWGYWITHRRIIYPVAQLNAAARRVGEGYFVETVRPNGNDELGQLVHAFNTMSSEVAAMRASLESQVVQRTREVVTAFEFSQEIVQQLNLSQLLRSVTERARTLMQAQAASLCLLSQDGNCLELVSSSGRTAGPVGLRQPLQRDFHLQVVGEGRTTLAPTECISCAFMQAHVPGRCAAAPLRVGENTLGALCVVRSSGVPFNAEETRAITLLANAAAIAINNARLAEEGRRRSEENAALAEREKLAAELHDNMAQTLGAINLRMGQVETLIAAGQTQWAVQELGRMQTAVKHAYGQVRAALTGLQAHFSSNGNLEEKLVEYVAQFRRDSGLSTDLTIVDPSALALPALAQAQALHIVREALTNVRRHARAQHVHILVRRTNSLAHFTIEDDGQGFNPRHRQSDNHLGLTIMQTRAERSGGHLTIHSAPGKGTRIEATFSLERAKVEET